MLEGKPDAPPAADEAQSSLAEETAESGAVAHATCPWCSASIEAGAATCPKCGAALVEREAPRPVDEAPAIPGVTAVDPALIAREHRWVDEAGQSPKRRTFFSLLSGVDVPELPAHLSEEQREAILPPSNAVRREMIRLELEALAKAAAAAAETAQLAQAEAEAGDANTAAAEAGTAEAPNPDGAIEDPEPDARS